MISVITASYHDWPELERAIRTLEDQDYDDWQHVVVHDGPNSEIREKLAERGYQGTGRRVLAELGRNWHGFMGGDGAPTPPGHPGPRGGRGSRGACAYIVATYLCAGEYIGYLDSDCEYFPRHLAVAAEALAEGWDFVYTMVRIGNSHAVGNSQPSHGQIDGNGVVHRADLLKRANWRWGGDSDWDLIARWMQAGARYRVVPEVTVQWNH